MLRELSSGQGRLSIKHIFSHVTTLIGENVITAFSEKNMVFEILSTAYTCQIRKESALWLRSYSENADPADTAELLLPYTNKRPSQNAQLVCYFANGEIFLEI